MVECCYDLGAICGVKDYLLFGYIRNSILINIYFLKFLASIYSLQLLFCYPKICFGKKCGKWYVARFLFNLTHWSKVDWLVEKSSRNVSVLYRSACRKIMLNGKMRKSLSFGCVCMLSSSAVYNSATLWSVSLQASLFVDFSKEEYWSGLSFLTQGNLPDSGIEPTSLASPVLASGCFITVPAAKPIVWSQLHSAKQRNWFFISQYFQEMNNNYYSCSSYFYS